MRDGRYTERRRCPRFAVAMRAIISADGIRYDVQIGNISMHGALAAATVMFPAGSTCVVALAGCYGERFELGATVIARGDAQTSGLVWQAASPSIQKQLRRLIWAQLGAFEAPTTARPQLRIVRAAPAGVARRIPSGPGASCLLAQPPRKIPHLKILRGLAGRN